MQPLATRQIEIGFVNRNHFHRGREFVKELAQPLGIISVSLVVAAQENRLGAKALGGADGHGGMDAVLARFVACRRHHAAPVRIGAHHHWLALERRVFELLHGNKKGVHVDVKNLTDQVPGARGLGLGTHPVHIHFSLRSSEAIRACNMRPTCSAIDKMSLAGCSARSFKRQANSTCVSTSACDPKAIERWFK